MTAREIAALFESLELRLVASLQRNLARHLAQETDENMQWPAWQALKLRELSRFRRETSAIAKEYAPQIDAQTRAMLQRQFAEADGSERAFFGVNGKKLEALFNEVTRSEERVQKAALRYMDDVYRKTILRANAAFQAGGVTLQQATGMAVQDFLARGITCVRYSNGRRVNIATYAEMALRTSNTRAALLGDAQKRERLGIDTVLVSQYGGCSNTCLPWQGLVYIDDVWQPYVGPHTLGGTYGVSRNGRQYPLLSVAMRGGLFHPNCRHTLTTWIEGVSKRPAMMDKAEVERRSKLETRQRALERKVRECKRLLAGTVEEQRAAAYAKRLRAAQTKVREFVARNGDVLRRDVWRERNDLPLFTEQEKRGTILTRGGSMDLAIDKFTPCLENAKTGEILQTSYTLATKRDLSDLHGWNFDWTSNDLHGCEIYKLTLSDRENIEGLIALRDVPNDAGVYVHLAESAPHNLGAEKKYLGVGGHLFAIAARRSYELGYSCFFFLDAKNEQLAEHYKKLLNATLLGRPHQYRLYVDEESAFKLIQLYSLEEDETT